MVIPSETRGARIAGGLWGLAVGGILGQVPGGPPGGPVRLPPAPAQSWPPDLILAMELAAWLAEGSGEVAVLLGRYLAQSGRTGKGLTAEVLDLYGAGCVDAARTFWRNRAPGEVGKQVDQALTRAVLVGLAFPGPPGACRDLARLDTALTHWDPVCREASAYLALLARALVRGEPDPLAWARAALETPIPDELARAIHTLPLAQPASRRNVGPERHPALVTLERAVAVLASGLDARQGLLWSFQGRDSTCVEGAVTGALLGARDGFWALPAEWLTCLPTHERLGTLFEGFARRAAEEREQANRTS